MFVSFSIQHFPNEAAKSELNDAAVNAGRLPLTCPWAMNCDDTFLSLEGICCVWEGKRCLKQIYVWLSLSSQVHTLNAIRILGSCHKNYWIQYKTYFFLISEQPKRKLSIYNPSMWRTKCYINLNVFMPLSFLGFL